MAAAGWDGWEVSSLRGNGQTAAAKAAKGIELEKEREDSETRGSFVQAVMVPRPTAVSTDKGRLYHKDSYDEIGVLKESMNRAGLELGCSTASLTQGPSPVESLLPSGGSSLLHSFCGLLSSLLPGPDSLSVLPTPSLKASQA